MQGYIAANLANYLFTNPPDRICCAKNRCTQDLVSSSAGKIRLKSDDDFEKLVQFISNIKTNDICVQVKFLADCYCAQSGRTILDVHRNLSIHLCHKALYNFFQYDKTNQAAFLIAIMPKVKEKAELSAKLNKFFQNNKPMQKDGRPRKPAPRRWAQGCAWASPGTKWSCATSGPGNRRCRFSVAPPRVWPG